MTDVKTGTFEDFKAFTLAIARGERAVDPSEPKIWIETRDDHPATETPVHFTSLEAGAKLLSAKNRELLRLIVTREPQSVTELADMAHISGGKSVSAVNRISANELKGYGTIAGVRRVENPRLIDVSLIVEKPAIAVAEEKLRVDGLPEQTWLGWFGMHLLAPSIYEILGEMIRDNVRDGGEFQLTRAQEIQRQREGYLALEMLGAQRFDFGVPDDFVASVRSFRLSP